MEYEMIEFVQTSGANWTVYKMHFKVFHYDPKIFIITLFYVITQPIRFWPYRFSSSHLGQRQHPNLDFAIKSLISVEATLEWLG